MKKFYIFVLIFIVLLIALMGFLSAGANIRQNNIKSEHLLHLLEAEAINAQFPFLAGETISYVVKLNHFSIGKAQLSYRGVVQKNGIAAILISFITDVANFKDLELIFANVNNFNPLWVNRDISFFGKKEFIEEDYALKPNSLTIRKYKNKRLSVPKVITCDVAFQNAITSIYYCRSLNNLSLGEKFLLNLPLSKLELQVKRIEDIKVPAGNFRAFYIESIPNKYRFWLSADKKRIPLKVEGAISFAPATMVMTGFKEN